MRSRSKCSTKRWNVSKKQNNCPDGPVSVQPGVLPAKAGIHRSCGKSGCNQECHPRESGDLQARVLPKYGPDCLPLDSRLRGNDEVWVLGAIPANRSGAATSSSGAPIGSSGAVTSPAETRPDRHPAKAGIYRSCGKSGCNQERHPRESGDPQARISPKYGPDCLPMGSRFGGKDDILRQVPSSRVNGLFKGRGFFEVSALI